MMIFIDLLIQKLLTKDRKKKHKKTKTKQFITELDVKEPLIPLK